MVYGAGSYETLSLPPNLSTYLFLIELVEVEVIEPRMVLDLLDPTMAEPLLRLLHGEPEDDVVALVG